MNKPSLIDALDSTKDFQSLLDSSYLIFKNPLLMHDINFKLMAFTDVPVDDPFWNELTTQGFYSTETQELFSKLNILDDIANTDKYVILQSDLWKFKKMVGYIYNKEHIKVAILVMYASNAPFESEDEIAFEKLADKISFKVMNDDNYTRFGRQVHQELIIKLIEGVIQEPVKYTPQMQILFDDFKDYLYAAVIEIMQNSTENKTNLQEKLLNIKSFFESNYRLYKYAVYSDYLLIIMSSKYHNDNN